MIGDVRLHLPLKPDHYFSTGIQIGYLTQTIQHHQTISPRQVSLKPTRGSLYLPSIQIRLQRLDQGESGLIDNSVDIVV